MNKMCPFATETLKTEKTITYDMNGRVEKVVTLSTARPQMCRESICPFYNDSEGVCRKVEQILEI